VDKHPTVSHTEISAPAVAFHGPNDYLNDSGESRACQALFCENVND